MELQQALQNVAAAAQMGSAGVVGLCCELVVAGVITTDAGARIRDHMLKNLASSDMDEDTKARLRASIERDFVIAGPPG